MEQNILRNATGIHARMNPVERSALIKLAEIEVMTLSEAVRLAIREACKARNLWPPNITREDTTRCNVIRKPNGG